MGFKWFKARMQMSRMPSQSSAIEGTYRIKKFDEPSHEFIPNNNQGIHVRTTGEQRLSVRAVSMPALNNPMMEVGNEDDFGGILTLSNNERGHSSSMKNFDQSEVAAADMYKGLGAGEPVPLKNKRFEKKSSENIVNTTPRPAQKIKNSDYRKKKAKAPMPKIMNRSSSGNSGNGSQEYVTLQNGRKTSQESDIDV